MFDSIGQTTVRPTPQHENNQAVNENDISVQRAERLREARAVEKSEKRSKSDFNEQKKEGSAKYKLENNRIIFEKYDRNGEVVFRLPPANKPIDEMA